MRRFFFAFDGIESFLYRLPMSWSKGLIISALATLAFSASLAIPLVRGSNTTPRENIVFILIDTLRADHLPFNGYQRDTAPFMTSLAHQGVVFERAFAASSWTAPSVASIFTSLYPAQHGVITGFLATEKLQSKHEKFSLNRLPESVTTMAEMLQSVGYRTFGIADNLNLCDEMGFLQGFDRFETFHYEGAPVVFNTLMSWKDELEQPQPYFLYLHFMDPHEPYHERNPWFQEWNAQAKSSRERVVNAYDSAIRFLDRYLEQAFQEFNWSANTLVIIVSDHGEEFWDHGAVGHGKTLYREVLHVPLLIVHSDFVAARIADPVQSIDLLPTLAEWVGSDALPLWQGHSLMPLLKGKTREPNPLFAQLLMPQERKRDELRSVIDAPWHFIRTQKRREGGERKELFNLESDFGERNNLEEHNKHTTHMLNEILPTAEAPILEHQSTSVTLGGEAVERLKTLGYIR